MTEVLNTSIFAVVFQTLAPPLGTVICASLLAGSFVRDARCDFSKSASPIFMKFGTDVQDLCRISLLTFEKPRSKFNVNTAVY